MISSHISCLQNITCIPKQYITHDSNLHATSEHRLFTTLDHQQSCTHSGHNIPALHYSAHDFELFELYQPINVTQHKCMLLLSLRSVHQSMWCFACLSVSCSLSTIRKCTNPLLPVVFRIHTLLYIQHMINYYTFNI